MQNGTERSDTASTPDTILEQDHSSGLNLTPENFRNSTLASTPTSLSDVVFLMGSIEKWREKIIPRLNQSGVSTFNPDMGARWDESYIATEALVMSKAGVLALRIEPDQTGKEKNKGLGSLAEIGIAVAAAKLHGQKVVVSVSRDYQASLTDSGAQSQFNIVMSHLRSLVNSLKDGSVILLEGGKDDLQTFADEIHRAMAEQRDSPKLRPFTKEDVDESAQRRMGRYSVDRTASDVTVVMGGSSGATLPENQLALTQKIEAIERAFSRYQIDNLADSQSRQAWNSAYESNNSPAIARLTLRESGPKIYSDVVVWSVYGDSRSMAAISEIGFLIRNMLETGQLLILLVEDFGEPQMDAMLRLELKNNLLPLMESFKNDNEAMKILTDLLGDGSEVTFSRVKKTGLAVTEPFLRTPNTRRVRSIVQQHLRSILAEMTEISGSVGVELFFYSEAFLNHLRNIELVRTPEYLKNRGQYAKNISLFIDSIDQLPASDKKRDSLVGSFTEAMLSLLPPDYRQKAKSDPNGLISHLQEVQTTSRELLALIPSEMVLSSDQRALVVEVVAPIHDIFKFLGSPSIQVISDHERVAGEMVQKYASQFGFNQPEIDFMVKLIVDHENIFKESGRREFIESSVAVERAKAIFFLADTLTGALLFNEGVLSLDESLLRKRFTDLYFRHIDKVAGKVFRPEWGPISIGDILRTIQCLAKDSQMKVNPRLYRQIILAGIEAIDTALEVDEKRKNYQQRVRRTQVALFRGKISHRVVGSQVLPKSLDKTPLSEPILSQDEIDRVAVAKIELLRMLQEHPEQTS